MFQANQGSVFLPLKRQPACTSRVVCFPFAGSGPYLFAGWPSRLGPQVEVIALQTPGRAMRIQENPLNSVEEIVAEAIDAFDSISDLPFIFYGHSLGATIAFELTRALRRQNRPQPSHLLVGAARPPHLGPTQPFLHQLPQDQFISAVQTRYGGVPEVVANEPELMALFLPALRADFTVYETYKLLPEPPLKCPITAFCGDHDNLVPAQSVQGWGTHTKESFALQILAGDHFFLTPHLDTLTDRVAAILKNIASGPARSPLT